MHWWMPFPELKPRGKIPIGHEGAICDLTAHGSGMTAKFSVKMTRIVEAKSIDLEYTGNFIGTGQWTFEPTNGKTKVNII